MWQLQDCSFACFFLCSLVDKAKAYVSFLMGGTKLQWVKLDLALVARDLLSKTLIQLAAYGWRCTASLLVVCLEATQLWSLQALLSLFSS